MLHVAAIPGETLDLGLPKLDDERDFGAVLPPGGIVLEQRFTGWANRWSGVTSTALKSMGLGGVEQWSLRVGRGLMEHT